MNPLGGLIGLGFGVGAHLVTTGVGPLFARRYRHIVMGATSAPANAHSLLRMLPTRDVGARQAAAGMHPDPMRHHVDLARGAVAGLALGSVVLAVAIAAGRVHTPVAAAPMLMIFATAGYLLVERRLDTRAAQRRARAAFEVPTVAGTMAIAVGAGASVARACELVSDAGGVLGSEFTQLVRDIGDGVGIDRALGALSLRLPVPAVVRFVDALRIAMERGTPVVDVLHAQALDARQEARRELLEVAGRREVLMLLPVVFIVLPCVVLIALYPAFRELASMA